jgi:4-hydroxybenzoate polyprenyltransferase
LSGNSKATFLRDIVSFYRLSRPANVLISAISFFTGVYCSGKSFSWVTDPTCWYLLITVILITASGYWINDVADSKIDQVNKPEKRIVGPLISAKKVLTGYNVVIILVLLISMFLPKIFFLINTVSMATLFVYSMYLKRTSLYGNLTIASLCALLILEGSIFTGKMSLSIVSMSVFAFEITLIREIVKDIEDFEGDLAFKLKTYPIEAGIKSAKKLTFLFLILFCISLFIPPAFSYYFKQDFKLTYLIFMIPLVLLPGIYLIQNLSHAKTKVDFHLMSTRLKWIMLSGMISMLFL